MKLTGTVWFELFFCLMLAGCAKTALPPPAAVPPPQATEPPRVHQADAPPPPAPKDPEDDKKKLSIDLPKEGNWQQASQDLVPKGWRAGFIEPKSRALVLMGFDVNAPTAPVVAKEIREVMTQNGTKCGPLTPLADGSGQSFTVDEGGGIMGKVAIRDLGKRPGKYVLQLYGQWPKANNAALVPQFDYIATHASVE